MANPIKVIKLTGVSGSLEGKADSIHTHELADITDAGTAASSDSTDFATAAQGTLATNAIPAGTLASVNAKISDATLIDTTDSRLSDSRTPTTHSHTLSQITDSGSAAGLDVSTVGNAAVGEVVKGDDTRLSDDRDPTAHTHTLADISDSGTAAAADTTSFATAAQGILADTALQNAAAFATAAQGTLADSALQAADLGTAAAADTTDFATAAQGALADTSLQNAAAFATAAQGALADTSLQDASAFATAAQGTLADTALQSADLGTASASDVGDFATAAQGVLADNADAKLAGIDAGATDDQTGAEIKAAYIGEAKAFTDAQYDKLNLIEAEATADMTGAEIKTAYQSQPNAFTDTQFTKLAGIDDNATDDMTGAEIKAAYETELKAFTNTQFDKLATIEDNATADQTAADIRTLGFFDSTNGGTGTGLDADLLDGLESTDFATAAQGALADTSLQNAAAFATAAQGALADTSLQDASAFATAAQGTLADTALQSADLGTASASDVGDFATAAQGVLADNADAKLAGIDAGATDDQTGAEIKAAYIGEAKAFTDAQYDKLNLIEAEATADMTGAEIKTAYQSQPNAFTDTQFTKLAGIDDNATDDMTGAEIKAAYETELKAFTNTQFDKLATIEDNATADQTAADIRTLGFFDSTNGGTGTGLDADLLDGLESTDFATAAQGALADTSLQNAAAFATAAQGALADTSLQDASAFATAAQGTLADTALQSADLGTASASDVGDFATAAQGVLADNADAKLAGIDAGATDDQTGAEIKAAYIGEAKAFTDAQYDKLNLIEAEATADMTGAEIKTAYQSQPNAFTDTQFTKLAGIDDNATDDMTGAEIKAAYETELKAFTNTQFDKLATIEDNATADQTAADIRTLGFFDSTNGGTGTGLDADLLDGLESTDFATAAQGALADTSLQNAAAFATAAQGALADTSLQDASAFATAAQGTLADTALQSADLGTASASDVGDFATAAQGVLADNADAKLAGIDAGATDDQTGAEIKAAYIGEAKAFTDAQYDKLNLIEAEATADMTGAEIKTAYQSQPNAFTDTQFTKLAGIDDNATADMTPSEIKAAYITTSKAFTDTQFDKLATVEGNATADQTATDIRTLGFFDITNDGTGSGLDADLLDGLEATAFATAAQGVKADNADTKLAGIDAGATDDQTPAEILTAVKTVDGTGSGLDADLLDGLEATAFATAAQGIKADNADTKLAGIDAGATDDQTPAEILTAVKTVDGTGSGLDADLLDGLEATAFATAAQGTFAEEASTYKGNFDPTSSGGFGLPNLNAITSSVGDTYYVTADATYNFVSGTDPDLVIGDVLMAKSSGVLNDAGDWILMSAGGGGSGDITADASWSTKGDLIAATGAGAASILPAAVTDDLVLTTDAAEATGLKWAAPAGGGLANIVEDTTPELGGDLFVGTRNFTGSGAYGNEPVLGLASSGNGSDFSLELQSGSLYVTDATLRVIDNTGSGYYSGDLKLESASSFFGAGKIRLDNYIFNSNESLVGKTNQVLTFDGTNIKLAPAGGAASDLVYGSAWNGNQDAATKNAIYDKIETLISNTEFDASGDLLLGTGSNTFNRLPIGSTDQVLTVSGGTAVWATAGGGGTTQGSSSTYDISAVARSSTPDARGNYSVDLQMQGNADDVAAGTHSALIGGSFNRAAGSHGFITAGTGNTIPSAPNSAIIASNNSSVGNFYGNNVILAHSGNAVVTTMSSYNSAIIGGSGNTLEGGMGGGYSVILGGDSNSAVYQSRSVILGGSGNAFTSFGGNACVIGGTRVKVDNKDGVFAWADDTAADYTITQDKTANFRVANGMHITAPLFIDERASALADIAGRGQIWVKSGDPNQIFFTDDDGTDFDLTKSTDFTFNPTAPSIAAGADTSNNNLNAIQIMPQASVGSGAQVRGTAIGSNTYAGTDAVSLGYEAHAKLSFSVAIGSGAQAGFGIGSGFSSIAIGSDAKANASYASAFGPNVSANADSVCEVGVWTNASVRDASVRMGSNKVYCSYTNVSPTLDGGITKGSEIANKIPREMFTINVDNIGRWLLTSNTSTGVVSSRTIENETISNTASLPTGIQGRRAFVTDSLNTLASHHGQILSGGGTHFVPVFHDGTNWIVG